MHRFPVGDGWPARSARAETTVGKFNGQAFTLLRRDAPPAASTTPARTIAPPRRVLTVGICRIDGISIPSSVAPTGSPRTVRLTTYAGRYLSAQFMPVWP